MPAMLGADPFPGPFASGPWLNGSDILTPWPCDADATASYGAWSSPWAQPYHDEIERLQQQVEDLKLWKLHAEESMRAYHQASFEGYGAASTPWFMQQSSQSSFEFEPNEDTSSPASSSVGGDRRGGASPLSALPPPLLIPLGPEPVPPPRPAVVVQEASESSMQLPPGLVLPPGLTLSRAAALSGGAAEDAVEPAVTKHGSSAESTASMASSALLTQSATPAEVPPGMWIGPVQVVGTPGMRAEWVIEDLRARLQACMGRNLVSPPFSVCGLPNLRLMVSPDAKEAVKNAKSRDRKGMYAAMVKKGPLHGALKLKADCLPLPTVLRLHLTVGNARTGPFTYDFSEQAIHGCDDFSVDWLKEVDEGTDNLRVGVEILEIRENRIPQ